MPFSLKLKLSLGINQNKQTDLSALSPKSFLTLTDFQIFLPMKKYDES